MHKKKTWTLTSSTFYQVSANTYAAYSSKSPRYRVSILTLLLLLFEILPISIEQESKRTLLFQCILSIYLSIGGLV